MGAKRGSDDGVSHVLALNKAMEGLELFGGVVEPLPAGQNSTFRLSPEPYYVDEETLGFLNDLGPGFYEFYKAVNQFYRQSLRGTIPPFFHEYLDIGKPEQVTELGRLNRFKNQLPLVIRPDIIPTEEGFMVTELDSVPGGMGLLAFMAGQYAEMGYKVVGGADGMLSGFAQSLRGLSPGEEDPFAAIVVSDESKDYRGEMEWFAKAMQPFLRAVTCHPSDLVYMADTLCLPDDSSGAAQGRDMKKVDILYRFFELFDLKNIPQIDLVLYAIRKQMVEATPPLKSYMEEKLLFALFHHPALQHLWQQALTKEAWAKLKAVLPRTWIMDSRPLPPHAVIPGLSLGDQPVTDFSQFIAAGKKHRQLVIKPSGFSPEAWGSKGVVVGHDTSSQEWELKLKSALASFNSTPHILQEFHKGRKVRMSYYDFSTQRMERMSGRARLCPYYFVNQEQVTLAGILATVVPLDKKAIHGMVDAIMVPVAVM